MTDNGEAMGKNYDLRFLNYEIRVTILELRITIFDLRFTIFSSIDRKSETPAPLALPARASPGAVRQDCVMRAGARVRVASPLVPIIQKVLFLF